MQLQVLIAEGGPNPLDAPADLGLWTLVIFVGLLFVLTRYAWRPILDGLEAREKSIEDNINSAKQAEGQAQASLKQYEDKLAGAQDEATAIIAEAKNDAIGVKEKILADANDEAQRNRERAMADIESAKSAAISELAESSVDSAVSLAGSIVGRSLDKNDHSKLIKDSLERFTGA